MDREGDWHKWKWTNCDLSWTCIESQIWKLGHLYLEYSDLLFLWATLEHFWGLTFNVYLSWKVSSINCNHLPNTRLFVPMNIGSFFLSLPLKDIDPKHRVFWFVQAHTDNEEAVVWLWLLNFRAQQMLTPSKRAASLHKPKLVLDQASLNCPEAL